MAVCLPRLQKMTYSIQHALSWFCEPAAHKNTRDGH